jgi:predicted cobalt transporter CbtA
VATVILSVAGFWLLFLFKGQWFRALGVLLLFAPHFWGAPQPADLASDVPAYLASQYATASLATTLFFWLALGLVLGWIWDRMKPEAA